MPLAGGLQDVERLRGGLLACAADGELHHHDGQAQDNQEDQVDQDECGTAVLAGDVGEAPDVAQSDCATRADKKEADAGGEVLARSARRVGGGSYLLVLICHDVEPFDIAEGFGGLPTLGGCQTRSF